jgi:hypothetical protein
MSLLGKVMAVLNVLAAAGFFALAGLDWAKRQEWADKVVQHDLVISGLPVDKNELDQEGHPRYRDIRPSVLAQLLGGPEVKTQEDEVQRVKGLVLPAAAEDPDPARARAAKVAAVHKLAGVLASLAETQQERDDLRKRVADADAAATKADAGDKAAADALQAERDKMQAQVEQAFQLPQDPADKEDHGDKKRRLIAHLLFRMVPVLQAEEMAGQQQPAAGAPPVLGPPNPALASPDSRAYQRYLAVVGLEAASRELDEQALALHTMSDDVFAGLERDRDAFVSAQQTLLAQIQDLAEKVGEQTAFLNTERQVVEKQQGRVDARKLESNNLEITLNAAKDTTKEELKTAADLEKQLFAQRKALRDAFEENQRLEKQIRDLEKGR